MWKPGQLITINGIVYRVKHADSADICRKCAFNEAICCAWPFRQYLVPANCYLERMSPIIKIVP